MTQSSTMKGSFLIDNIVRLASEFQSQKTQRAANLLV
jgi:hypothetical protein